MDHFGNHMNEYIQWMSCREYVVVIDLQHLFCVQYVSLDSLRSGKVQYYNKHIMDYNQAHNYNPALTISNKVQNYTEEFVDSVMNELTHKIAKEEDLDSYWLRGCFYMNKQEYTKAIEDFNKVLQQNPNHLLALFNRANTQMLINDYIESIEDNTPRKLGEGVDEYRKIDFSSVLEGYEQCLKLDPNFLFACYNMANVFINPSLEESFSQRHLA